MVNVLIVAGAGLGVGVISCLFMMVFARRLPPGLLRQVAEFLPACVTTARVLRKDPAVPRRAKVALLVAIAWVVSPIDLLPEFLPLIGPLDDVVAVVLLLGYAARSIPRETLLGAWPTDPHLLERLLGPAPPLPAAFDGPALHHSARRAHSDSQQTRGAESGRQPRVWP